jgi:hypothetical protein
MCRFTVAHAQLSRQSSWPMATCRGFFPKSKKGNDVLWRVVRTRRVGKLVFFFFFLSDIIDKDGW